MTAPVNPFFYATIDTKWDIIEFWNTRDKVKPEYEYHRIVIMRKDFAWEYDNMYDFNDVPF